MVKKIITDESFLSVPCVPVEECEVVKIIGSLLDTAIHHHENCLGLAANQIGYQKRAFVVFIPHLQMYLPFINPRIIDTSGGKSHLKESCLSRPGKPPITKARFKQIRFTCFPLPEVPCPNKSGIWRMKNLQARIVQHEMDHLDGILI